MKFKLTYEHLKLKEYHINTSTVRAFCPGCFPHFASGLEPRHIGARPKGTPFGLSYHPKP